jgi:hypothetical protein
MQGLQECDITIYNNFRVTCHYMRVLMRTNNFEQSFQINSNLFCYDIEKYIYF